MLQINLFSNHCLISMVSCVFLGNTRKLSNPSAPRVTKSNRPPIAVLETGATSTYTESHSHAAVAETIATPSSVATNQPITSSVVSRPTEEDDDRSASELSEKCDNANPLYVLHTPLPSLNATQLGLYCV